MKNELRGDIRLKDIDSLKGLAIIGVVLLHMSFNSRFDFQTLQTIALLQRFFEWSVIAFFFASGFTAKPTNNFPQLRNFFITRTKRLLIPYFIFCVSYKIILHALALLGLTPSTALPISALGILRFFIEPIGPQFYFLPYLLLVSTLVATIDYFLGKILVTLLFGLFLTVIYFYSPTPEHAYGADFLLLPVYFYAYVAGKGVAASRENNMVIALIVSPIFLSAMLGKALVVFYAAVPILLFLFLCRTELLSNVIDWLKLGEKSSSVYVWHAPIVLPVASIISVKFFGEGIFSIAPTVFLSVVICYSISYLTFKFNALKYWRF